MSESIEEIISRSLHEGMDLNTSCELTRVINKENDHLNALKSIKEHLEKQSILPMLFQIQKEIYTQTCEKQIQEFMATQFSNKITTIDELRSGIESFINSFHLSFKKLNNAIISVIGRKYLNEFFNNSPLNKSESDINPTPDKQGMFLLYKCYRNSS
jgi:hypothetical protein